MKVKKYKKKICCLFLIFFVFNSFNKLFSDTDIESHEEPFDAIVNLGADCQVAYQLKINNLRYYALPFDYLITPFNSLYFLLKNHFQNFLNKENLKFINDKEKYVSETYYTVNLIHDFKLSEQFLDDYESVKQKYDRRIARFYDVINRSKKILFIRKNITKDQVIALETLLCEIFPDANYKILALSSTEEIKRNWDIQKVINFYLKQPIPYSWKGDDQAWKEILSQFNININSVINN